MKAGGAFQDVEPSYALGALLILAAFAAAAAGLASILWGAVLWLRRQGLSGTSATVAAWGAGALLPAGFLVAVDVGATPLYHAFHGSLVAESMSLAAPDWLMGLLVGSLASVPILAWASLAAGRQGAARVWGRRDRMVAACGRLTAIVAAPLSAVAVYVLMLR